MALLDLIEFQKRFGSASSMAIVGSSDSVLSETNGKYIDECDLVVRFNRVNTSGVEAYVGERTDILVVNDVNSLAKSDYARNLSNPKVIVCFVGRAAFSKHSNHQKDFLEWAKGVDVFVCVRPEITNMALPEGKRSFSMGLYALGLLPELLKIETLCLTGFTFFGAIGHGSGHHTKKSGFSSSLWHDADLELSVAKNIVCQFRNTLVLTEDLESLVTDRKFAYHVLKNNRLISSNPSKAKVRNALLPSFGYFLYKLAKIILKTGYILRRLSEILRRTS